MREEMEWIGVLLLMIAVVAAMFELAAVAR